MVVTAVRAEAARVVREQLAGTTLPDARSVHNFCDSWIELNVAGPQLRPYFEACLAELKKNFTSFRDAELLARFAMRAIKKCVDPN